MIPAPDQYPELTTVGLEAAERINSVSLVDGVFFLREKMNNLPQEEKQYLIDVTFGNLTIHNARKLDKIYPLKSSAKLMRIAIYLRDWGFRRELVDPYLIRALDLGANAAATLYLDIHPEARKDEKLLENALANKFDSEYALELAKICYKKGDEIRSVALAEDAAYSNSEAAHFLIHVLGKDVSHWSKVLHGRGEDYNSGRFKESFSADGFRMLQKSELETSALHGIEIEKIEKKAQRILNRVTNTSEKWVCNQALLAEDQDWWLDSTCHEHKDEMASALESGRIKRKPESSFETQLNSLKKHSFPFIYNGKIPLREWQSKALDAWAAHGRQGIIEAATGSGKSRVGAAAAIEAMEQGLAVVIVVPTRILQQQWIEDYFRVLWNETRSRCFTMGNDEGVYVRHTQTLRGGTITVAVVDTLAKLGEVKQYSDTEVLIIADEVHNYSGEKYRKIFREDYSRRLGLTATLQLPEGRYPVIANYFAGGPFFSYSFKQAVQDKVIMPYKMLLVGVPMDPAILSKYRRAFDRMILYRNSIIRTFNLSGDLAKFPKELEKAKREHGSNPDFQAFEDAFEESDQYLRESTSKANVIRVISEFLKQRGSTLIFCDFNLTSRNVEIILADRGISTKVINQSVPQSERKSIFSQFDSRSIQVLLSPKVLDEGVDIKHASVGVFAGTTRRRLQIVQRLGRVLRIQEEKPTPLIILPVAIGTEEDPNMPENGNLEKSAFGVVFEQATESTYFPIESESEILGYLAGL